MLSVILLFVLVGTFCDIVKHYELNRHQLSNLEFNEKTKVDEQIVNDERILTTKKPKSDGKSRVQSQSSYQLVLTSIRIDPMAIRILLTFSAYSNAKKVFHVAKSSGDQLQCIHAIRNLSFMWVILGHTFAFGSVVNSKINEKFEIFRSSNCFFCLFHFFFSQDNPTIDLDWTQQFTFQIVTSGLFSVDSFFMLRQALITLSLRP